MCRRVQVSQWPDPTSTDTKAEKRKKFLNGLLVSLLIVASMLVILLFEKLEWNDRFVWVAILWWTVSMGFVVYFTLKRSLYGFKGWTTVLCWITFGAFFGANVWLYPRKEISGEWYMLLQIAAHIFNWVDNYRICREY